MDILIKNGSIIDGTGRNAYSADVLINNDTIVEIGKDLTVENCEVIDASNRIVAPGFIDMHNHADLTILKVNTAAAYLMQGVTTMVVSVCGIGLAPANEKVRKYYTDFITKLFGSGELVLYDTLEDYFDKIEKAGISPNLTFLIPHGNVRCCVLGVEERPPTEAELEEMKEIVKEGMEAGAFGLSTGLMYPPGSVATTEELIELCKVVRHYGGIYDSHMRNEGTGVLTEGMGELIRIAGEADIQAQISHWKAGGVFAWKLTPDMISLLKRIRNEGLNIYADMYPYEEGATSLSGILLPPWVFEDFDKNLSDPETRKKIVNETFNTIFSTFLSDLPWLFRVLPKCLIKKLIFAYFKRKVRILSVVHNHRVEGKFLGQALETLYPDKTFMDALLDFLRDEEGGIMVSFKIMNERKSIIKLIQQDFVAIGSDGFLVYKGNTHPRSYGCFPKILGNYVREKRLFSLEEGIRKMTGLPARILGIGDRGVIQRGKKADIVVFDPNAILDKSTYENGCQFPEGIDFVIVNGKITVANGKHIGTLSGKILRRSKNMGNHDL